MSGEVRYSSRNRLIGEIFACAKYQTFLFLDDARDIGYEKIERRYEVNYAVLKIEFFIFEVTVKALIDP